MELKYLKITLGVLVIFSIFAFGASAQASSLGSKHWTLVSLNGKAVANSKAYIEIDPSTTRFNGNAGCNRMFGSVKVGEKEIAFSGVATTKMACVDRGVTRIESEFTEALPKATRYKVAGNVLSLYEGNRRIMRFTTSARSSAGGAKLEEKKWVLEAIGGKASGVLGEQAFVNFVADTAGAGGNTSCNVYGGNYTVRGNTLSIVQVISTMRACIEDDRMTIERSFLNGLQNTNKYEIRNGKLYLYRGDELLLTFRGERKQK